MHETPNALQILETLAADVAPDLPVTVKSRSRPGAPVDAVVYLRGKNADAAERLRHAFDDLPWVDAVEPRRGTLGVRFGASFIDAWARRLAAGDVLDGHAVASPWGERVAVQFLDANLSKALHVGHLWSISLGQAFAAMAEHADARVTRRLWYADAGRNMFEAVAGVLGGERLVANELPPRLPPDTKSDHFVGTGYARYVASVRHARSEEDADSPIDRELARFEDRAERLMRRWLDGDPVITARWRTVRDWAFDGQQETLERLGVRFDEKVLQSSILEPLQTLVAHELDRGLLERADDGRVVYRSPREEFDALTVIRSDGFPTEYGRLITLMRREQALADEYDHYVAVSGDEWSPATALFDEFLERSGPTPLVPKLEVAYHAMLTLDGEKMKSRDGRALLIDQLFDQLSEDERLLVLAESLGTESLGASSAGQPRATDLLADILVRLVFLSRAPRKSFGFSWRRILDESQNPGWAVCRQLVRLAELAAGDSDGDDAPPDREGHRRLLVARALESPGRLRHALASHDPRSLCKFLLHVTDDCAALPPDPALARLALPLVTFLLGALGLPIQRLNSPRAA
ncbi:MAG: arginine--tRNA ligase [Acidobacteriota bacterium]